MGAGPRARRHRSPQPQLPGTSGCAWVLNVSTWLAAGGPGICDMSQSAIATARRHLAAARLCASSLVAQPQDADQILVQHGWRRTSQQDEDALCRAGVSPVIVAARSAAGAPASPSWPRGARARGSRPRARLFALLEGSGCPP